MTTKTIECALVEFIPEQLNEGVLYVAEQYNTAVHKCCCGCGEEVVTPLSPVDWKLNIRNNKVSLYPSIGNWSFACRSHYWIRNGAVQWSYNMSEEQIQANRRIDQTQRNSYINSNNRKKEQEASRHHSGWFSALLHFISSWLKK